MANPEHLAILKQGVEVWNQWRKDREKEEETKRRWPRLVPDISGTQLTGYNLRGYDLSNINLKNADLEYADLRGTRLYSSDLTGISLRKANCRGIEFGVVHFLADYGEPWQEISAVGPNLVVANFGGADLTHAVFNDAWLDGSIFAEAILGDTQFIDVDLGGIRGLEQAQHKRPSRIDTSTIVKSRGRIPEGFLRGCGLSDGMIEYAKSLTRKAIQFYSGFISHSTNDKPFADRLYADLQNKGVRCWFAPHDIQGGKKLHEQIDEAIRVHERLLLILSEHSMGSEWVKTEISKARKREIREKKRILFPIRLVDFETFPDWECFDADTGKDSAREIREYFIPDFSNWTDHDSYQAAFERLLRDLKTDMASPPAP